jgi:hypothetical protein
VARARAYQQRQRDAYGRFIDEGAEPRASVLTIRLTRGELDAIADIAAARDMTVTALVVAAVGAYGRGACRDARTIDRADLGL